MYLYEDQIQEAANELRTWGGVAVIGAGASFAAGLPLSKQLISLLWSAVDLDSEALQSLAEKLGTGQCKAKELIGDDPSRIRVALEYLSKSTLARKTYQEGFSRRNVECCANFSPAHDALAELVHRGNVLTVVSLNWDSLLESAYHRRYGTQINAEKTVLYKPHGDALEPDEKWVLPHEAGYIPDALLEELNKVAGEGPRCLLIVGYSESDEIVVSRIIAPLSEKWRLIRIGPDAHNDLAIPGSADLILPKLRDAIHSHPEVPGWEYVTFQNQHELGSAIGGNKLGPSDVEACPQLPEVVQAVSLLEATGSVEIVGRSGCGKSITAYQVAHEMNKRGWEVLRLSSSPENIEQFLAQTVELSHMSVLIVDDAQRLERALVRRLFEAVSGRLNIIVVTTENTNDCGGGIHIAGERAVTVLVKEFLRRRDEILCIVKSLDPSVGESYMDTSIERRIEQASESKTPWEFCFVLRGGWNTARQQISSLRDFERADLLLLAVAVYQKLGLDTSVSELRLKKMTIHLGFDQIKLDHGFQILLGRKLLVKDSGFRCPHIQFASNVLRTIFSNDYQRDWYKLFSALKAVIERHDIPLMGISWLLFDLWYADAFHGGGNCERVVDDAVWRRIEERCMEAATSEERRDAAFVLNTLARWQKNGNDKIARLKNRFGIWFNEVDGTCAYALGNLINDVYNHSKELAESICNSADPYKIAKSLQSIKIEEGYSWGHFLGRLAVAAHRDWCAKLLSTICFESLQSLVRCCHYDQLSQMSELICGLCDLEYATHCHSDGSFAFVLADILAPKFAPVLSKSPVTVFNESRNFFWLVLGYIPQFLRKSRPRKTQRCIARKLVGAVDVVLFANNVSTSSRREWPIYHEILSFFHEANPRHNLKIIKGIDIEMLDSTTTPYWGQIPRELYELIATLSVGPDEEPARTWVSRHEDELRSFDSLVAAVSPDSAIKAIKRGARFELGDYWDVSTLALARIADSDRELAMNLVDQNYAHIAKKLSNLQPAWCEGLSTFLRFVYELNPGSLESILAAINPAEAERLWTDRLRGKVEHKEAAAAILGYIDADDSELSVVAQRLRKRFPRAGAHRKRINPSRHKYGKNKNNMLK